MNPLILATWRFGQPACKKGYSLLANGLSALDAVEAAANVVEEDPTVNSVGYGGLPNAEGVVELDAAIMDGAKHAAGAVAALTGFRRPISVARCVMERTPHVMLVGENAKRFALQAGFVEEDLLTETARQRWLAWKSHQTQAEVAHFDHLSTEGHDTIGLCALDTNGNLAAGCTTSGLAWKLPGRVGDSPIIGSGLYVDNELGAAAATGDGDEIMKVCLSYRTVMLMESGYNAQQACEEALRYLLRKRPPETFGSYGAALIALRKDGDYGAAATRTGFQSPDRLWTWAVASSEYPEGLLREGSYVTLTHSLQHL
jgi:N4-(beta-N-acetylglucosaminyl)-L-asparaginase